MIPRSASLGAWVVALALCLLAPLRPALADARPSEAADAQRQVLVLLRSPTQHFRPDAGYGGAYGDAPARAARLRAADRLARLYGVALVSDWPIPTLGLDCLVMSVPAGQSAETAAARLAQDPGVSWSEPMHLYHGEAAAAPTHDDPLYRTQPAAAEWRLAELHRLATGRNVRIAVIDSAIDKTHPDLAGQVEVSENFVAGRPARPEQHGTGVAGVIAARSDNRLGIAGIAPGARLMALRACWQETPTATVCDSLSLAKALDFAISHRAQLINMSLAGPPDMLLGRLLDAALARGQTVVAAYDRAARGGGFPASHAGVIAVADEPAGVTAPGIVAAPGRDVPTTQPGGRWAMVNGSSYAAAHVAGLLALARERAPPGRKTAMLVVARVGDTIDACATLLQTSGPCDCDCSRPHGTLAALRR